MGAKSVNKKIKNKRTVLIMAGGTGGHVFPALSVAKELSNDGVKIVWLGTRKGIEKRLVKSAGYKIHYLTVEGLVGTGIKRKLLAPFTIVRAVFQALKVIRKVEPDCVLGMGGFASGPGGLAAKILGKKIVIHEQNAFAGLTNRKLANFADSVLTGFRACEGLPETRIWVGNPVRKEIYENRRPSNLTKESEIRVLVLGGSQGALSLNQKLPQDLSTVAGDKKLRVWHQTGDGNSVDVNETYRQLSGFSSVLVEEFIKDIDVAYKWADLVVCRAGAMTISELMAAGKPSVLIPYPYAAGDHQTMNAKFVVNSDAGLMVADSSLGKDEFLRELKSLIGSPEKIVKMAGQAAKLYSSTSARQVADFCKGHMNA